MSSKRMHLPGDIHFVTNRCFQSRLLMLPDKKVNFIIGYWFARALELHGHGLKIYAFIFLSNHMHILLRDMEGSLAAFMCYFESNVARAINRHRHRKGTFWQENYDDKIIDGETTFWEKYAYVTSNAVKAGLINHANEWIGWCSYKHQLTGQGYSYTAINRNLYNRASRNRKKKPDSKLFEETYSFRLETPPGLEQMSIEERADYLQNMIAKQDAVFREQRDNKKPLGVDEICLQDPFSKPKTSENKPKKRFDCETKEKLDERMEAFRMFSGAYATVHEQFKENLKSTASFHNEWPIGSYPPSRCRPFYAAET